MMKQYLIFMITAVLFSILGYVCGRMDRKDDKPRKPYDDIDIIDLDKETDIHDT